MRRTVLAVIAAVALTLGLTAPPALAERPTPIRATIVPDDGSGTPPTISPDGSLTTRDGRSMGTVSRPHLPAGEKHQPASAGRDVAPAPKDAVARIAAPGAAPTLTTDSPSSWTVQAYETTDINDCMADPNSYGARLNPHSHLYTCGGVKTRVLFYVINMGVYEEISWIPVTITTIGYTMTPGLDPRSAQVVHLFEWGQPTGPQPEAVLTLPVRITTSCAPGVGSTSCVSDAPQGYTMTVAEWIASQSNAAFSFTTPATDGFGAGPDSFAFYNLSTFFEVVGGTGITFGQGDLRCDWARGLTNTTGCVFPNPDNKDTFRRIDYNDPNVFFSVSHINDALVFPNTTLPPARTKLIPGLRASGNALNRAAEQKMIDANRAKSQRACKQYDPDYAVAAQQNLQCDEYPFASTYQGAASNTFDFSVREIPAPDNLAAGNYLRAFYQTFRIADGDPFWVELRKDPQ